MSKTKKIIILFSTSILFLILFSIKSDAYCWPIANSNGTIDYNSSYIEYGYGKRTYTVDTNLWKNEVSYCKTENHHGVDITGTPGATYKIVSVSNGTVIATSANRATYAGTSFPNNNQRQGPNHSNGGGYGNYILVKDSNSNFVFVYAHLSPNTLTVKKGDSVRMGQVLGTMGSSGDAGHMHLHFEIRRNTASALSTPYSSTSNMKITSTFDYESNQSISINPVKYIYTKQMATDFVTSLYNNILGRNPETTGLNNWVNCIMNGTSLNKIVSSFYNSKEFKNKNYPNEQFVEKLYIGCLQRNSDSNSKAKFVHQLNNGVSRSQIINSFVNSSEFTNLTTKFYAQDFVSDSYKYILGRAIDSSGKKYWTTSLMNSNSPVSLLNSLYNCSEFTNKRYSNNDYVEKLYRGCLHRASDAGGKNNNIKLLNSGTSRANLLKSFTQSKEYQRLVAKKYGLSNIGL